MVPKLDQKEIIEVIKDMVDTVRQLYGNDVLVKSHKLRILLTGGGGDFSVALNVRHLSFKRTFFL